MGVRKDGDSFLMAEIIQWRPNKLGYAHVVCGECYGESFHIKTDYDKDGMEIFYSIICTACGNEIFCGLQPVWGPGVDHGGWR